MGWGGGGDDGGLFQRSERGIRAGCRRAQLRGIARVCGCVMVQMVRGCGRKRSGEGVQVSGPNWHVPRTGAAFSAVARAGGQLLHGGWMPNGTLCRNVAVRRVAFSSAAVRLREHFVCKAPLLLSYNGTTGRLNYRRRFAVASIWTTRKKTTQAMPLTLLPPVSCLVTLPYS